MQITTCAECGARIDLDTGLCPVCGTSYYTPTAAPKQEAEGETRSWGEPLVAPDADAPTRCYAAPLAEDAPAPPRRHSPKHTSPRRARKRGGSLHWLHFAMMGAVLLAILAAVLVILTGVRRQRHQTAAMPGVVGQTEASAESVLAPLDLRICVSECHSDTVMAGVILAQEPKKGEPVETGDTVLLTVSLGPDVPPVSTAAPEALTMPALIGSVFTEARDVLAQKGITLEAGDWVYDEAPRGEILSQSLEAGEPLTAGDTVTVTVSLGQEPEPTGVFTISATAGKGGTVSPTGQIAVEAGSSISFAFYPQAGYVIDRLEIDGVDMGIWGGYTFNAVDADHALYVTFRAEQPQADDAG